MGGDADDQRRPVDHGAELEVAESGVVDRVHRDAGHPRGSLEGSRLLVGVGVDKSDGGAAQIVALPSPLDEPGARAQREEVAHRLAGFGRDHVERGAGRVQQLRLPDRALGSAREDDALARQGEEDGQNRELPHRRSAGARGFVTRVHVILDRPLSTFQDVPRCGVKHLGPGGWRPASRHRAACCLRRHVSRETASC